MTPLLHACRVSKSFQGVRVLNDVSLELRAGEVHAVVGENGAGKSTLMKILAGLHRPDSGVILMNGEEIQLSSPHIAFQAGIAMIHQELMPFLDLSVAENIFMGQEPVARWGFVHRAAMHRETDRRLSSLGVRLNPATKMRQLKVADMQLVEIAKALAHRASVIIMDEPTSALSHHEVEALFGTIRELSSGGVAVVYISHKLEEVFALADCVTVLRDGMIVGTHPREALDSESLIHLMVGREFNGERTERNRVRGDVALVVNSLGKAGKFSDISFDVHAGEIVGLAGLMGAGRTELVNAIYGLEPADSGEIRVHGAVTTTRAPRDAIEAGIGLVTEDRKCFGLVPTFGVRGNVTLAALRRWCRGSFIQNEAEQNVTDAQIRNLRIRAQDREQPVLTLSGGNQQKVVLARTLLTEPRILLLDEPTRGIDIGAKAEVHAVINELAAAGKAVVLVSSELPELLTLSDRILVLRGGRLSAELDARKTTPAEILHHAICQ